MKKTLLSLALIVASSSAFAQTTLFEDGFETYTDFAITGFGGWNTLDLDLLPTYIGGLPATGTPWTNANAPQAFMIFNPSTAGVTNNPVATPTDNEVRNFDPHGGLKYAAAWAAVPSTTGGPTANNDWLISPPINLGLSGNSLTFWVKSLSNTYGLDQYRVGVYVGSGTPTGSANFTYISGPTALSAPYTAWEQKIYSLDTYAGQTVRIGIQAVSADVYMLMVDDFRVSASVLGTSEVSADATALTVFPNPATEYLQLGIKGRISNVSVTDMSGKSFTVPVSDNKINVRSLPTGAYILSAEVDTKPVTAKFIKK